MRDIRKWSRWREQIKASPVFAACWESIKRTDIHKKITKGTWSVMAVDHLSKEELLSQYYEGADRSAPQYQQLLKDIDGASELCVFTTETTDTTGLSKQDIPALIGKTYTVILDAQQAKLLHVEEGVQVA